VAGQTGRRRAETLYIDDLRVWLNGIAEKAKIAVVSEAKKNV
jgi:hypothetical protein